LLDCEPVPASLEYAVAVGPSARPPVSRAVTRGGRRRRARQSSTIDVTSPATL